MIINEIIKRRSVREFRTDSVPEEMIDEIIRAAQFAPTARNNRAVEFIVIRNLKTKSALYKIVGQEYVKEAPLILVLTTDTTKTGCPVEDLSAASENVFLQATNIGLGTVWKAVKEESQEAKIKQLLGIPLKYKIINIIPVGYPKVEPEPHRDSDFDASKIHLENW
ncbi:MAG: nitroreductase family protein [Patescibacteria group bacterium]|jgi:nitroreductase